VLNTSFVLIQIETHLQSLFT